MFIKTNEIHDIIYKNLYKIPHDIDVICFFPRGGAIVGGIISLYLNKPLIDFESLISGKTYYNQTMHQFNMPKLIKNPNKILLVDDLVGGGRHFEQSKILEEKGYNIIKLSIFSIFNGKEKVDISLKDFGNTNIIPEWEFYDYNIFEKSIVDFDGVLGRNNTVEEDMNEEMYINFLKTAEPLFIPSKVLGICSYRLEKYRNITTEWLQKYNINYGFLDMCQAIDKRDRDLNYRAPKLKSDCYNKHPEASYFIESSYQEASEIFENTKRKVFSIENEHMFE